MVDIVDCFQFRDMWRNEELEEVYETMDDSWRHGVNKTTVFKDDDGRFWQADYRVSGDGEYHGIRDNEFEYEEVFPVTKTITVTEYIKKEKPKTVPVAPIFAPGFKE